MLKKINYTQWTASTFIKPIINDTVRFNSDFKEPNEE